MEALLALPWEPSSRRHYSAKGRQAQEHLLGPSGGAREQQARGSSGQALCVQQSQEQLLSLRARSGASSGMYREMPAPEGWEHVQHLRTKVLQTPRQRLWFCWHSSLAWLVQVCYSWDAYFGIHVRP